MIRRLNPKEEQVMRILWSLKKAYIQEIIEQFEDPKPHYNTISSIIRKLESEGYVGHLTHGRSHRYYSVGSKKAYRAALFEHLYTEYFGSKKKFIKYACEKLDVSKKDVLSIL